MRSQAEPGNERNYKQYLSGLGLKHNIEKANN
jgi:hypothetical protein